ncbi:uncharacterized protein GGS22DRAFT_199365 [Annulohypoxylon maeteangense]|uniref:uncharacterized protein n=1 Tax=Annulohypoxylon maeteangense TaxID=1927788 RepID=UPI002007A557|nr:uncharacterized protein GGS22DRAFT_199365 [Annulohypoxylon maeteangense]KAI0887058.1 hypothetical protein GGS22DRAFT_199365 [Annulohypoxylon maeteangense]
MKTSSIFASAIFAAATLAIPIGRGSIRSSAGLPSGYSLSNLTWTGNITEDGPEMSFTGFSFRDIDAQILDVNPDFTWPDVNGTDPAVTSRSEAWLTCDPNNIWYAQAFRIEEGIDYLSKKTGQCHMDAGPRVCTRISCSYKSAIWWCNDNTDPIEENCLLWSHYAQEILDSCRSNDASNRVRGQKFSSADWNIMIGFDDDHC